MLRPSLKVKRRWALALFEETELIELELLLGNEHDGQLDQRSSAFHVDFLLDLNHLIAHPLAEQTLRQPVARRHPNRCVTHKTRSWIDCWDEAQ